MAHSLKEQRQQYPLAAYNFLVTVEAQTMSFARVTGLQREHQSLSYRHGLSFREGEQLVVYAQDKYQTVTLERGVVISGAELYKWLEGREPRALDVSLCDANGQPVMAWRIAHAIPVKLSASTLDAKSNEVAVETLELKASKPTLVYHG